MQTCSQGSEPGRYRANLNFTPIGPSPITEGLDSALDVRKVQPYFYAAEVGAFGANGSADAGSEVGGGTDVFGPMLMDLAELGDFVERGLVDLFLGVEAGAHGPFVKEMEEGAGFYEANGFCVGQKIEGDLLRNAAIEELIFGTPCLLDGAIVDFFGARIFFDKNWRDVVGFAGVGQRKQRAGAGNHAMTLVLAVGGVADFFL